jgi:hypothetical protein
VSWLTRKMGLSQTIIVSTDDSAEEYTFDIGVFEVFKLAIYVKQNMVRPHEHATDRDIRELILKEALRRRGFTPRPL